MLRYNFLVIAACTVGLILLWPPTASAERPPQSRAQASLVAAAEVAGVRTAKRGFFDDYFITLKVSGVVRGNARPGDTIVVTTFQKVRPSPPGWVGPSGHGAPPPNGAKITAYLTAPDKRGRRAGIYKDWFDLVAAPDRK